MGKAVQFFDDPDTWFNGTKKKTAKSKGAGGGATSSGSRPSRPRPARNSNVKNAMKAMNSPKKIPQVMVKISGSSKGCDKAQAHANYIGRKGQVEIEDESGQKFIGSEQKELLKAWEATGVHTEDATGSRKEAFHFVFSMPAGTNPDAMKDAVRNLVQEEFSGHKYLMAQHLDTDSPHCHVMVAAADDRGARLNPRKADLHNYRVAFVNKLAEQGIEATASRRIHRFKYQDNKRQGVLHRDGKVGKPLVSKKPTSVQMKKIEQTHALVEQKYKEFQQVLPLDIKQEVGKMLKFQNDRKNARGR